METVDVKLDPKRTWFNGSQLWVLAAVLAAGVWYQATFVSEIRGAIVEIRKTVDVNKAEREKAGAELLSAVRDISQQLKDIAEAFVSRREFDAWVAMLRQLNEGIALKVPELPR